jgi:hypothetical protein
MIATTYVRRLCQSFVVETSGQSLIEAALVLPFLLLVTLGVVELGVAIQHQHSVSTLSREGSNLISRDTTLEDAGDTLKAISNGSVDFDSNSRVIFSVLKRGGTVNTSNYGKLILYERYEYGGYSAASKLRTIGTPSFGSSPTFAAPDSDNDTSLQLTNAPAGLATVNGGLVYVTEVFSRHTLITPLNRFGVNVPQTLYSVAYF